MRLCQWDGMQSFTIQNEAKKCLCSAGELPKSGQPVEISFYEIIPVGLCPFAYYSIIPYWVAFKQGASFLWRKSKDDVVCQCPKKDGVVFLVRRQKKHENIVVTAEVVSVGDCPNKHSPGQIFEISNPILCPGQFPSFWAHWQKGTLNAQEYFSALCSICSGVVRVNKSPKLDLGLDGSDGQ